MPASVTSRCLVLSCFVKDMTKSCWCVLRFTVLTAVHLQNSTAKFHKVGLRHYSDEAENVYISVRQIYPGQHVPNFITVGQVCRLYRYIKKHFGVFSVHSTVYI